MAPPPEYDKEPKAPDKSATNIFTEDSKLLHNVVNEQHTNSDHKPTNTVAAVEVENNKDVETLDDGQLRALLDEAITYKCPKDREGKSSLFKELLEEVEQDEQACEAAARAGGGQRGGRRGARGSRRALPHSNSLQDLVAALAAEPAPRRAHVRHHAPATHHPNVSARAIHGGSLPSGVDTSSLLSEESMPVRGAGYLATVRCVNPPPLAERRVSASDANTPAEMELLNRRSKPMFPMTYTARATLEIGSGAVSSGRAVTTTTPSNQVRTHCLPAPSPYASQHKLMDALRPKRSTSPERCATAPPHTHDETEPRGPTRPNPHVNRHEQKQHQLSNLNNKNSTVKALGQMNQKDSTSLLWKESVNNWYKSLSTYTEPLNSNKKEEEKTIPFVLDTKTDPKIVSSSNMEKHCKDLSAKTNIFSPDIHLRDNANYNLISYIPKQDDIDKFKAKNTQNISGLHYRDEGINRQMVVQNCEYDNNMESDISLRKKYRKQVGENLVVPTLTEINPRNVRRMTIGQPYPYIQDIPFIDQHVYDDKCLQNSDQNVNTANICSSEMEVELNSVCSSDIESNFNNQLFDTSSKCCDTNDELEDMTWLRNPFVNDKNDNAKSNEIELIDVSSSSRVQKEKNGSFSQYVSDQQRLLETLENGENETTVTTTLQYEAEESCQSLNAIEDININSNYDAKKNPLKECSKTVCAEENEVVSLLNKPDEDIKSDRIILAQLPNNAYIFLAVPKPTLSPHNSNVNFSPVQLLEIENNNNVNPPVSESNNKTNPVKKKTGKMPLEHPVSSDMKKSALDKNVLKVLLFESLFKNNSSENLSGSPGVTAITGKEVDSAISFSCITTPEVVSSCNTTPSTAQSAVALDPKPRSVISSSFNGLPLSRPNYGSTGTSASDEYKKSLDENGNSVQGFSSPLSGSSQHKKPRRKKSSKNETVIDCQQIDGYQGDKDVNELLRFIESNADNARGPKLGRVKHKDDSDDKSGKKRSTERRKDKEQASKMKRATSMEELSRTKIEDLTDVASPPPPRRSDAAAAPAAWRAWPRDPLAAAAVATDPAAELTDFQTVTKKRKPRRRTDEHERDPPRRARAPSPRAPRSPPSDRSNDSNDDMDSVHSLPAAPPPPPPPPPAPAPIASYAEIARTRHNIPDLIESCNFYAEGEGGGSRRDAAPAPGDADGYPALEARAAAARRRDGKPAGVAATARRERKERAAPAAEAPRASDCPAPDVLGERRPPVILLDSAVRPRDLDGVTFGFDINEQLLSGGRRRARVDLLEGGECAPCAALRYVPPDALPLEAQLLQLVDYVAAAWEDVVRAGAGKVRYFSE